MWVRVEKADPPSDGEYKVIRRWGRHDGKEMAWYQDYCWFVDGYWKSSKDYYIDTVEWWWKGKSKD